MTADQLTHAQRIAIHNAIADFAEAYVDQNERDYDALKSAVRDGRVKAVRGI